MTAISQSQVCFCKYDDDRSGILAGYLHLKLEDQKPTYEAFMADASLLERAENAARTILERVENGIKTMPERLKASLLPVRLAYNQDALVVLLNSRDLPEGISFQPYNSSVTV